jgi:hypothetical protein
MHTGISSGFLQSTNTGVAVQQKLQPAVTTTYLGVGNGLFGGIFAPEQKNGPKTVLDIPCSNVKVGPLKFFLQIFLVGEQNTPVQNSWVLNQNDERQTLDMYFTDGTGMFSIDLKEYGMKVWRYGQAPSLQYQLQESVLLHSLLDEVEGIAFAEDIAEDKRLIQFKESDGLEKARETLPARRAEASQSKNEQY